LSRTAGQRTSGRVTGELFDMDLRRMRRNRASRTGPALFLHERAFDEILERLDGINRSFGSALLVGAPDPQWPLRLSELVDAVTVLDPGASFARAAGGSQAVEDSLDLEPGSFDLIVAVGTLDTVNDLPAALLRLRFLLRPDSLLIGAISGGNTLPRLRQAMRAADAVAGAASPHVHPRIEPAAFAQLLGSAGLAMPVVDVDRVPVAYRDFGRLVADLRAMGATNILTSRSRKPLTRAALVSAERDFRSGPDDRTVEIFELLHFAAWSPAQPALPGIG
jgi:NADH dehydrogenase [ubiquinone] 1 alpha subcomplex assembly factor 5